MTLESYSIQVYKDISGIHEPVDSEELDSIQSELSETSGFAFDRSRSTLKTRTRIPWFGFYDDLCELSARHPSLTFSVLIGEDSKPKIFSSGKESKDSQEKTQ